MQVIEGLSVTERFYVEFFEMGQMTIQESILKTERKQTLGTTSGALLRSDTMDCKQQRVTLMIQNTLSDAMDTHVTTRLSFKPTCFTAASLTLHPPASHFRSTTLHVNYSSSH